MTARRWVVRIGVLLLLLVLPRLIYPILAVDILCWGLFALAFDLVFGYAGLLSFGHAMFWGTSAYVTANLLFRTGLPVPVAILLGTIAALVLSLPTGYLSIRSAGIYFSMVTLAFAQMIGFRDHRSGPFISTTRSTSTTSPSSWRRSATSSRRARSSRPSGRRCARSATTARARRASGTTRAYR